LKKQKPEERESKRLKQLLLNRERQTKESHKLPMKLLQMRQRLKERLKKKL